MDGGKQSFDRGPAREFVDRVFRRHYGTEGAAGFGTYLVCPAGAALGYRRAGAEPLFLEAYLDAPVEQAVSDAFGRPVARQAIIEIGNLASTNAMAMIDLWGAAANDLGAGGEVVVATLTAPLRRMFRRIGIALHDLGAAEPGRLGTAAGAWGSYYEQDPRVCAGAIAQGQEAIADFLSRRTRRATA